MPEPYVHSFPHSTGFIPTLAVSLWLGVNGFLVYLLLSFIFLMSPFLRALTAGSLAVLAVLPLPKDARRDHRIGFKFGDWVVRNAARYFGLTVTVEDPSSLEKIASSKSGLIFGSEPHDILPYPIFAFNDALSVIPHVRNCFGLMTSAVFKVPLLRHVYSYTRGSPVDKKTFITHLENKDTVIVVPGGVNEVFLLDTSKPDDIILFLKSRKGFIKLALKHGTPVVPCFTFGLSGSYKFFMPPAIYRSKYMVKVTKMLGFLPVIYFGRFGIPYGIPLPNVTNVVIDKPIFVEKVEGEVSQEILDRYHALYIKRLVDLFERHKSKNPGYEKKKLVIL